MILTVDVGNSNIIVGAIQNNEIVFSERIRTDVSNTELNFAVLIKSSLDLNEVSCSCIEGGIISSVVPPITHKIATAIQKLFKIDPMIIGKDIDTGLELDLDNPNELGADLIVGAVAAKAYYNTPLVIIDAGTATTISVVGKDGKYLGGTISPGMVVAFRSLSEKTSMLPSISFDAPANVIGKNTIDCMKSAAVYGNASMLDGMIDRIESELGEPIQTVVATGGLAQFVVPYCKHKIIYDDALLLKGLYIIYEKNS